MGAVWYQGRTVLRRALGATVLLTLLVGLTGGAVLAAVAGARRSQDAIPEFLDYIRGPTVGVQLSPFNEDPGAATLNEQTEAIVALPEWGAVGAVAQPVFTLPPQGEQTAPSGFVATAIVAGPYLDAVDRPLVVDGRPPDPDRPDEVAVNDGFVDALGLGVGDSFVVRTIATGNIDQVVAHGFTPDPDGEDLRLTITGVLREPWDLGFDPLAQDGTIYAVRRTGVYLTRAFWARHGDEVATYNTTILGRPAPGVSVDELTAAVRRVAGDGAAISTEDPRLVPVAGAQRGVDVEANALLVFALVLGAAGALLIGQALGRRAALDLLDADELRALGLGRAQRAAIAGIRGVVIAVAGSVLAVGVAVGLSGLLPIGTARAAEVHLGIDVDPLVLGLGVVVITLGVLGRTLLAGWRSARAADPRTPAVVGRPSATVGRLASAGAPVTVVSGVRLALERGRGRNAVPVLTTVAGTVAGVLVVTAALVFSASLHHVVTTPAARGWDWDIAVGAFSTSDAADTAERVLARDPDVTAYDGFLDTTEVAIDGVTTYMGALGPGDPTLGPTVLEGRLPEARGEIAVGPGTLADLGKQIGDQVRVEGTNPLDETIVGVIVPPATLDGSTTLLRGAMVTQEDARAYATGDPQDTSIVASQFLVDLDPAADRDAALARLEQDFPGTVLRPTMPNDLENLRRVQRLPALVAGLVALVALGTLANALVVAVRRRRRDLALLATIGFRRRQLAATVGWQATTLALLSLAIGVPLGIAAGRLVWRLVVDGVGPHLDPTVPALALLGLAAVWLVVANLVAALPARAAARTHPAAVLAEDATR